MSLKEAIIYLGISIKWAQVLDRIFHPKKKKKSYTLENKHKHKCHMNIYDLYVDSFCI